VNLPIFTHLMMLAVESSAVVALRTLITMSGSSAALLEMMLSEKIAASVEATASWMAGHPWMPSFKDIVRLWQPMPPTEQICFL